MPAIFRVLISMDQSTIYSQLLCIITVFLCSWFGLNKCPSLSVTMSSLFGVPYCNDTVTSFVYS